jgi:hypothetical protein
MVACSSRSCRVVPDEGGHPLEGAALRDVGSGVFGEAWWPGEGNEPRLPIARCRPHAGVRLHRRRSFADFVNEQRSAVGFLEDLLSEKRVGSRLCPATNLAFVASRLR